MSFKAVLPSFYLKLTPWRKKQSSKETSVCFIHTSSFSVHFPSLMPACHLQNDLDLSIRILRLLSKDSTQKYIANPRGADPLEVSKPWTHSGSQGPKMPKALAFSSCLPPKCKSLMNSPRKTKLKITSRLRLCLYYQEINVIMSTTTDKQNPFLTYKTRALGSYCRAPEF